jgi:hypothetical protein
MAPAATLSRTVSAMSIARRASTVLTSLCSAGLYSRAPIQLRLLAFRELFEWPSNSRCPASPRSDTCKQRFSSPPALTRVEPFFDRLVRHEPGVSRSSQHVDAWREGLLARDPWARGLTINRDDEAFVTARRRAALERYTQGREAWNARARGILDLKKALAHAGTPPAQAATWNALSEVEFSTARAQCTFREPVRFTEISISRQHVVRGGDLRRPRVVRGSALFRQRLVCASDLHPQCVIRGRDLFRQNFVRAGNLLLQVEGGHAAGRLIKRSIASRKSPRAHGAPS